MTFLIGGANSASGYEIENSVRFNDGDSARLTREFDQAPTSLKTFTLSFWVKRSSLGANQAVVSASTDSNNNDKVVGFRSTDAIEVNNVASGSDEVQIITNRLFRDVSAWYHIVVAIDTTQSAIGDGVKFYVNGVRDTDYDGTPVYTQNAEFDIGGNGLTTAIGMLQVNSSQFLDGYVSQMHYIDGQQLAQTSFGETNNNGVWIPKKYSGSYGNNGFFLEFQETGTSQNSSGIGADTSGNDQHFAVTTLAATDVTVDTPTNNFATFNPLDNYYQQYTYAEGNLKVSTNADYYNWNTSTIGVNSGKWYVEGKMTQTGTGTDNWVFGVATYQVSNNNHGLGADNYGIAYRNNGNYKTGDANNTHGASFGANDIVMIALDLDNDKVYFGHGGQWADGSGNTDESDLSNSSSAVDTSGMRSNSQKGDTVFFAFGDWNSNAASTVSIGEFNFGNPVHSISSGNADANGYGNFEYAPPSGFYALCTKNLAKYG